MSRFTVSKHATERALDMALDPADIREVLQNPRHRIQSTEGRELWTRGKLTAVVAPIPAGWTVVTFVWATAAAWAADRDTVRSRDDEVSADQVRAMRHATKKRRRGHGRGW